VCMVPTVRESQEIFSKSGKVVESQGKIRKSEKVKEFYILKSGKNEMVRENKSTRVQKLTKMEKKI